MQIPQNVSAAVRRLNPHLYPVARLANPQRQPDQWSEGQNQSMAASERVLRYRIFILSLRRRLVDGHDNLRTGAKPLVDRITFRLGFSDDSDPRLTWEYGQGLTEGPEGTAVIITAY